jgi:predicted Rossmann fold nucleotide-binding protein DprA/Smf involved in DNA uptake
MLSPDSQALLLLCSHAAIANEADLAPLTLREWNALARKIQASKYTRPEGLLGQTASDLKMQLELTEAEAERLGRLLGRAEELDEHLRRLASLGIKVVTRADADYPQRYRQRLKDSAPTVLFYAGEPALLGQPGIAVVGSRHLDQAGQECASFVGNACGLSGLVLYSGGAKGVDTLSMNAALEARGTAVGILADSLLKAIRNNEMQAQIKRGDACLVTPYSPEAGFSVGAAMGRNKLIYCLADYAIVVASDYEKGGTWAGATEAIKAGWLPVFVLEHGAMPEGNRQLLQKGGVAFPHPFPEHYSKLASWLQENSLQPKPKAIQPTLF